MKRAIVLFSGGIDSATALAVAINDGFNCHALSFRYGQRHVSEVKAAEFLARRMGVRQSILDFDLRVFGSSALTSDSSVPHYKAASDLPKGGDNSYVPARNTIFLSFALAQAEVLRASDIYVGVNLQDYDGYPDCRPQYLAAYERMANLATHAGIAGYQNDMTIHAPLIEMTKADIIRRAIELDVPLGLTQSCYDPGYLGGACHWCSACVIRREAFEEVGVPDPQFQFGTGRKP